MRLRSSVAQVPRYTQESMFLRGSLDLAPVSLLANPQLETPFLYPENHRNILPSWLSRERTATRYCRCWFQGCLRQPILQSASPVQHIRKAGVCKRRSHWFRKLSNPASIVARSLSPPEANVYKHNLWVTNIKRKTQCSKCFSFSQARH